MSRLVASGGQSTGASASASRSNEYSGLISFRIDWFDLAVQGTLKMPESSPGGSRDTPGMSGIGEKCTDSGCNARARLLYFLTAQII